MAGRPFTPRRSPPHSASRAFPIGGILLALVALLLPAGCATRRPAGPAGAPIVVAASIDTWGSILAQLGGSRVRASSIIASPATDPHDYEPTPADARLIADAAVFVYNGVGYDTWATKAVRADPEAGRQLVDVGRLTATPADGNPHRWYDPADVRTVADAITAALERADPADAGYFDTLHSRWLGTALAGYHQLLAGIRARFAGTPVAASESVFSPLAQALGLNLVTPAGLLRAVSEGSEPSTADKARVDRQLSRREVKVYVFNSQNATPDVTAQVHTAERAGIPVVAVTETLTPEGTSFQDWQSGQLRQLQAALARATGR
jgi:zinc/manganese transport system substrate-binding protein